jgi:uncharacterized repeat protein (TIGR01451 family)
MVMISSLVAPPAYCQETEDSQVFIAGFNAYQQKNYTVSIEKFTEVLQKYPDTPLKDMALFWLARSYYKTGNQQEAARYLSQFSKEFPDNPLKNTVEAELLALTARYEKGEQLAVGAPQMHQPEHVAVQKPRAEKESVAPAKADGAKLDVSATESARIEALKQAAEKDAAEKKEMARVAAVKSEQERISAARIEEGKLVVSQKAEQDRLTAVKAEEALRAEASAEATRIAAKKAERIAKEAESNRLATIKAEESRLAQQKIADEKVRDTKLAYREKAISQYKNIIEKFPASNTAVTAAAKLRELGVAVALPPQAAETPSPENSQILRFEVAQYAGLEFNLLARPEAFTVGRPIAIPFEVINRSNGNDSFYLVSAFPSDFKASFVSVTTPEVTISQTPELAPGESFKGLINIVIPPGSIDGLRISHPVKAVSRLMAEASQSREVRLAASAPLLRAVLRTEKATFLPGDKVVYRIAILNVGSTNAQDVTLRLNFPPQLEPIDQTAAGFRHELKSALVFDGIQINSGESRDFNVAFLLKDDSLAGQELLTRAELTNNPLKTTSSFVSNIAFVDSRRSALVHSILNSLVAIPGQTITVPFVITNTGNIREKFKITANVTGNQDMVIFNDLNRDGIRQASEPIINEIGPLAPREEANVGVEIKTPKGAVDGSQGNVRISFASEGDTTRSASGSTKLTYSRPVLKLAMAGRDGRLKPGDVASFDLTITNNGSNLARVVELQSALPEQLELVAADPATSAVNRGTVIWRFKEMGAGEKRSIMVSFRVKPETGAGTAIQVKNILNYEDHLGNRY